MNQISAIPQTANGASEREIKRVLAAVQERFLNSLDDRICRIETAWIAACKADETAQAASREVEQELHNIAGLTGSFGLADIGARARALELAVSGISGQTVSDERLKDMDARISAFLDLLEQHLPDP